MPNGGTISVKSTEEMIEITTQLTMKGFGFNCCKNLDQWDITFDGSF